MYLLGGLGGRGPVGIHIYIKIRIYGLGRFPTPHRLFYFDIPYFIGEFDGCVCFIILNYKLVPSFYVQVIPVKVSLENPQVS